MSWALGGLLVVAGVLVVSVHGIASLLTLWNLLPVALGAVIWGTAERRAGRGEDGRSARARLGGRGFAAWAGLLVALPHLAWLFDWGGTATAGSTSGLIFLVAPLVALVVALAWTAAVLFFGPRGSPGGS